MEQALIKIQKVVEIHPLVEEMLLDSYEEHWSWYTPGDSRANFRIIALIDIQSEVFANFCNEIESELVEQIFYSEEWRDFGYTDAMSFMEDALGGDIEDPELRKMIEPDDNLLDDVYAQIENYLIQYQMFYRDDWGIRNIPVVEVW